MQEVTTILYRPVGRRELELVRQSGWRRWPPRLPEQPIFYPVTNEQYAVEIASRWNVEERGSGYVTRFLVRNEFISRYDVHCVGAAHHTEWWIPAEDVEELNANIVGTIEVVQAFGDDSFPVVRPRPAPSTRLHVRFHGPSHGWLGVVLDDFELTVSYTPNDFLRELVLALLAGTGCALANMEPDVFAFEFVRMADDARVTVTHRASGDIVYSFSGRVHDVIVPFWRALRRLETEFVEAQWRHPFPATEMAQLTARLA